MKPHICQRPRISDKSLLAAGRSEEYDLPGSNVEANDEEGRNARRRLHRGTSIKRDKFPGSVEFKGEKRGAGAI